VSKFFSVLCAIAVSGCGVENTPQLSLSPEQITASIKRERVEKNDFFKRGSNSPLPEKSKSDFPGLDYFPVDLTYRLNLYLKKYDNPKVFKIITSTGDRRDTQRYGYFNFELNGVATKLQVYKLLDTQKRNPGYLFLPFTDETSGVESYPGGRYLDLKENASGYYTVDFNVAYNPLCAYGKEGYNCPIPPEENRLPLKILAGEKKYEKPL